MNPEATASWGRCHGCARRGRARVGLGDRVGSSARRSWKRVLANGVCRLESHTVAQASRTSKALTGSEVESVCVRSQARAGLTVFLRFQFGVNRITPRIFV